MIRSPFFCASLALLSLAQFSQAAPSRGDGEQAREYEQARRIALKDAKVQAAFARANERLQARIIEIDPTLQSYIRRKEGASIEQKPGATASASRAAAAEPQRKKPAPAPATARKSGQNHVVAAGETLGGIAQRYRVSVTELKRLNQIADERKLSVGQVLSIPAAGGTKPVPKPAPAAASVQKKDEDQKSWWKVF